MARDATLVDHEHRITTNENGIVRLTTDLAGTNDALTAGLEESAHQLQHTADAINADMTTMRTELDAKDAELAAADVAINLRIDNTDANLNTEKERNDAQDATLLDHGAKLDAHAAELVKLDGDITATNTKLDENVETLTENLDDTKMLLEDEINDLEE